MADQPKTTDNLYHLILGLPEEITSPNYYELLGLDARTSNPQVIKNSAADQNRKLLGWQNSDRYAEVRALTFEVVQARDTLLNPESRDAYDAKLGDWGHAEEGPWIVAEPEPLPKSSSEPLSVHCPDCDAEFKLRNRDLIGRRIPCPDCGFRFRVQPEEPETIVLEAEPVVEGKDSDAELKALDNFDDMEDLPASDSRRESSSRSRPNRDHDIFEVEPLEEEYEDYESIDRRRSRERGRNRSRTATAPRPRQSSRSSISPTSRQWAVLGGGALMAVGLIVLVVALIQRIVSPSQSHSEASERLAYLPVDCETVGYYRLGDLARAPAFQDHLTRNSQLREAADRFRDRMGMELHEIESVTIGVRNGQLTQFQGANFIGRLRGNFSFVAVARSSKDWDRTKLIGGHTQSATHNGETYHTFSPDIPRGPTQLKWAFYLADARTLLFGTEAEVQAAIETGGSAPAWPRADFLRQEYAIIVAKVPDSQARPTGHVMMMRDGARAEQLGSGLLLDGNQIQRVSFLSWDSETSAANYVALGEDSSQRMRIPRPSGVPSWPDVTFQRTGQTVAVVENRKSNQLDYGHSTPLYSPLELLASLGIDSTSSVANSNLPGNAGVESPPNKQLTNVGVVPPDVQKLNGLIADLQVKDRARKAAEALEKTEPNPERRDEVTKGLETVIETGEYFDKIAAIKALGVWGNSENVPFVVGLVEGEDTSIKKYAFDLLGQWKDPRALPIVVDSLENIQTRFSATQALKKYGAVAEPELLNVLSRLTKDDWGFQLAIFDVLRAVGTSRSLPQLDALASASNPNLSVKIHAKITAEAIRKEKR